MHLHQAWRRAPRPSSAYKNGVADHPPCHRVHEVLANPAADPVFRVDPPGWCRSTSARRRRTSPRLFDKAEGKEWILFFGETDALFASGPTSSTPMTSTPTRRFPTCCSGSRPFGGLVILATDRRSNIDEVFLGRFQSAVCFHPRHSRSDASLAVGLHRPVRGPRRRLARHRSTLRAHGSVHRPRLAPLRHRRARHQHAALRPVHADGLDHEGVRQGRKDRLNHNLGRPRPSPPAGATCAWRSRSATGTGSAATRSHPSADSPRPRLPRGVHGPRLNHHDPATSTLADCWSWPPGATDAATSSTPKAARA